MRLLLPPNSKTRENLLSSFPKETAITSHILKVRKFHDLMPHRIREVLLVSTPYDAFILEEDGHLTEQIFTEYKELSLSSFPRVTYAPTGEAAIQKLKERRFGLVLTMTRISDMDVEAFGRKVKKLHKDKPVVLLAMDRMDWHRVRDKISRKAIDQVFVWTGDAKILLAIIKYIEDRMNVDHDIRHGNVRVIIVLEDSVRFYSSFLGLLYSELMAQSRSLYAEGVNQLHRLMSMKSRPKILHATSYEEGVALFSRYKKNVLAVISDARIPRGGKNDPEGGLKFIRMVRRFDPEIPVLLQSAERENEEKAKSISAQFLDKNSPSLLTDIRRFLTERLGFGDFVFRLPDGREVDRAKDIRELAEKLHTVPAESLEYHAIHKHFSIWLMARSEFELAERLRPRNTGDFDSLEESRNFLIGVLEKTHEITHLGVISDFNPAHFDHDRFSRIGKGSMGGKARGIAFLNMALARENITALSGLKVEVPKTVVITTGEFDTFMDTNDLWDFAAHTQDDLEIAKRFMSAWLSDDLRRDLAVILKRMAAPLAVRSSSLLEDSLQQPFAGIYSTIMFPNNAPTMEIRLKQLCNAIKLVYASAFFSNAKSYLENTGYRAEEEKMAVIIQRVVGRQYDGRFYPTFSGVAQSYNYYPIGPQKSEDGIVHMAFGLGRTVVDGGLALRFSPRHPEVLPQFPTAESFLRGTQTTFYAIETLNCQEPDSVRECFPRSYELSDGERDGSLALVGSVFDPEDRRITEDMGISGPRLVSFNNILKHKAIPLAEVMAEVLKLAAEGLGGAVEIEFACEMGDYGRRMGRGEKRREPVLHILQVRPFAYPQGNAGLVLKNFGREQCLCRTRRSLGHGVFDNIRDIVYVRPERWRPSHTKEIACEVGKINKRLVKEKAPYLLIGPGRWGSADPRLGIPVQWAQISGVRVMVEASPAGYNVDPSHGTHFFQNITALRIGYLTIPPGAVADRDEFEDFVDWKWLGRQPAFAETKYLRHLRLETPLNVILDGSIGEAVIAKPLIQIMNNSGRTENGKMKSPGTA